MNVGEESHSITLDNLPISIGRGHDCQVRLGDVSISRKHAEIVNKEGTIHVLDCGSSYGTYVNGVRIQQWPLRTGDTVRFGLSATYVVAHGRLLPIRRRGMSLAVDGLQVAVPGRILVEGVSFLVRPSQNVGILGPSGAGKTMLLRCLAGVREPSNGTISTDEQEDIWEDIQCHRERLAFVPQQDIVYPLLSVEENLEFAAALRFGDVSQPWARERIEEVIQLVGLQEHTAKPARVLSGGQRKRLHVAMELLAEPDLLLLDEPTAGLDPGNEARWMEQQRLLARQGSTVVCSTHLMENIRLFDWVVVLGRKEGVGRLAYQGPPEQLLETLKCRHFADLYEKLETGNFKPTEISLPETVEPDSPLPAHHVGNVPIPETENQPEERNSTAWEQLGLVFRRTLLGFWRDRWLRWITLLQPIILALALAIIQFSPGRVAPVLFLSLVVSCWLGANNAIRELVRDRKHYVRDRLSGMVPDAYLAAKLAFFSTVGVVQLLILVAGVKIFLPWTMPEGLLEKLGDSVALSAWFFVLLLVNIGSVAMALIASTFSRTEEAAVSWLPLLLLPQILLSASATGVAPQPYYDARPFRPLAVTLAAPLTALPDPETPETEPDPLNSWAVAVDGLSLLVLTRPALLVLDPRAQTPELERRGISSHAYLADLMHLLILVAGIILLLWLSFGHKEYQWPAEAGY